MFKCPIANPNKRLKGTLTVWDKHNEVLSGHAFEVIFLSKSPPFEVNTILNWSYVYKNYSHKFIYDFVGINLV